MSIQQNFPAISPSLNLNFARSKTLDPRITFSRTTTATRVNEQGLVEVVSADEPRFDHEYDASTGVIKSLGLLVEESRSNLFNYTEDFTQLPVSGVQDGWFRGRVIPTTESVTAPDGSSGVSLLTENNTAFGEHYVAQEGFNYTSGVTYTWSWYVKPNGRDNVYCKVYTNFNNTQVILNLETSSEYYLTENTFDDITNTKLPNGWYRVSFTSTATSTGEGSVLLGFAQSTTVRSYTGDGSSGMYYWGAQVEAGAFPTSYIPNGIDSQATRNPDSVSMTGDNFSDWYNPSEFSLFANFKIDAPQQSFDTFVTIDDGTTSAKITFYRGNLDSTIRLFSHNMGGIIGTSNVESGLDVINKSAYAIAPNNTSIFLNGNLEVTNTVASNPIVSGSNTIRFGCDAGNGATPNTGRFILSQLTYYPRRLTNTQLQNLTK